MRNERIAFVPYVGRGLLLPHMNICVLLDLRWVFEGSSIQSIGYVTSKYTLVAREVFVRGCGGGVCISCCCEWVFFGVHSANWVQYPW